MKIGYARVSTGEQDPWLSPALSIPPSGDGPVPAIPGDTILICLILTKGMAGSPYGQVNEAELQVLYSRVIAPFWDLQLGWRGDLEPRPRRNWAAFGVKGLAPISSKSNVSLFLDDL